MLDKGSYIKILIIKTRTWLGLVDSYRSTVWNRSVFLHPIASQASRKLLMFSICLKAIFCVLIFLTDPGLMELIRLHKMLPDFNDGETSAEEDTVCIVRKAKN